MSVCHFFMFVIFCEGLGRPTLKACFHYPNSLCLYNTLTGIGLIKRDFIVHFVCHFCTFSHAVMFCMLHIAFGWACKLYLVCADVIVSGFFAVILFFIYT